MMQETHYDVAIIGGGPAGLQAALILARTRRRVVVFESPEPPRNAASHGVHNFLGIDGLTPAEIRQLAWAQIDVYESAELRRVRVINVQLDADNRFLVTTDAESSVTADHVILALGFHDVYPDVPGFLACWGTTIFSCPYCDGFENRDRVWGLVVTSQLTLEHMPHIYRNWTRAAKVIVSPDIPLTDDQRNAFAAQGITVHQGEIVDVHHIAGKVEAVTLNTGESVAVQSLWWKPDEAPQPLTQKVIANFNLDLRENGAIKTDEHHQTSTQGLWAVGDVLRGQAAALVAAYQGSQAAYAITRLRHTEHS
jgi:thioredoxin reductase